MFKAKTTDGYVIKILLELLQSTLKTGCFEVDADGIKLCMIDSQNKILTDILLQADKFSIYKLKVPKLYLGVNLNHFHKMLKSVKKKDAIMLFIEDDDPTLLGIRIIPKEHNMLTTSFLKVQSIQNIDIELPIGYKNPMSIPSSEYQKLIKDLSHIGTSIELYKKRQYIQFSSSAGNIYSRRVSFGELDDDYKDEEPYVQKFETEQMLRIIKISGLSGIIQIFTDNMLPLLLKTDIGNIGRANIYLKSNELVEKEK